MRYFLTIRSLLCMLGLTLLASAARAQSIPPTAVDSLWRVLRNSKPDTNRVNLLLHLGAYQVLKPGELPADMDSALSLIRQAEALSTKLKYPKGQGKSNLLFSQVYREKGERETGKDYIKKAIVLFSKHHFIPELGEAYLEQKHYYSAFSSKEELSERIRMVEQALSAFQQSGNRLKQATTLQELADLHTIEGNLPQSLIELKQALVSYQDVGYPQLQGVYDLLGGVSSQLGDYKEGIRYGLLAIQTAEQLGDSSTQTCTIYNRLGLSYYYLRKHEQALAYFQKGLSLAIKLHDENPIHILTHNISNALQRLNRSSEALAFLENIVKRYPPAEPQARLSLTANFINIYLRLKQYIQAKRYFNQLLQIEESNADVGFDYITFSNTAIRYLFATRQYSQARKYLLEQQARVEQEGMLKEASTVQKFWFQLDSAQGNYLSAIHHYQRYKTLEDSLLSESNSRQVANLEIQYQTRQREKDLQLKEQSIKTLTKEKLLQDQRIKQDQLVRNVIIGGAVTLLLLLAVIYNRYRLKQRSNQQLQARQEEINHKNTTLQLLLTEKEWLLKEIHHRVKNNLQVVMSLLNSQARYLSDEAALSAIQESQHRVQAMALIHQKLYQSERVARIPMPAYLEEVVTYLRDSYDLPQPIRFELAVEPIELDVTQAVPLGLIINEALTNAFKYAFPRGRPGTVGLSLQRLEKTSYQLTITDNGVGLPAGYDPSRSHSLGMTLLHGFSEQLGGELTLTSPPGLTISLVFAEEQLIPTHTRPNYAY